MDIYAKGADALPLVPRIESHISLQENGSLGSHSGIRSRLENARASTGPPGREDGMVRCESKVRRKIPLAARGQQQVVQRREKPESFGLDVEASRQFGVAVEIGVKRRGL